MFGGMCIASTGKTRAAVLPLEAVNLEPKECARLAGLLVQRLQGSRAFTVAAADRVHRVVKQEGCAATPHCLQEVARKLRAETLFQLRAGRLGRTVVLRLSAFNGKAGTRVGSWQEVLDRLSPKQASDAFDRMIVGFAPRVAQPTRWYQRWWVWTAAVSAVAAGTVTAVLLATRGSAQPNVDVIIRPP